MNRGHKLVGIIYAVTVDVFARHERDEAKRNQRNKVDGESDVPVVSGYPAYKQCGEYHHEIADARLHAKGFGTCLTDGVLRNHRCGKRYDKTASHTEQTAQDNQLYHLVGEEIQYAGQCINRQTASKNVHLVFRRADFSRAENEWNSDEIRKYGQ